MANYDIIGSIAIMKFGKGVKKSGKLREAKRLLKARKAIKTVLEKSEKVSGRLRTIKTRFLAGEKNLETVHKENNCSFKVNVEKCYFSPRLAEERKSIAKQIKENDKVLVMFAGVNPYGIVIAKISGAEVVSVELGKDCCKYAKENAKKNKVSGKVELLQGDVKKKVRKGGLIVKGKLVPLKFDVIVMPRPNLRESFLKEAFQVSKKGTRIFYYCFGKKEELKKNLEEINKTARQKRKKIKINKVKKAGEIAPFTYRWRVDFVVQ